MPPLYFATRTYRAQSTDVADERLVNAYLEHAPEGAKSQTPVMNSPGIVEYDDIGEGPTWGEHVAQIGNRKLLYVVAGDTLYSINDAATPVLTSLGTILGRRRVHMSSNAAQLVIVNGLHHYVYTPDDGLLKLKFGLGMDGDFEITTAGASATSTSVTMTLTGGPASAVNVNEIIVSIQGDSQSPTFFSDRPSDADTISDVATDLAATIDADGDFNASASAGVITITPQAVTNLEAATVVATSYHHLITIGDSYKADDYITLTTETVGNSDETFSLLITSSHTQDTIASALQALLDASSLLTATVSNNIITVFGQTAGTHLLTDIYSTQDWAAISGAAPYSKQVWALDGYMLYPVTNTPSFMISALNNASRIDVLDIASMGAAETNLIGMCVNRREIFLLGENYSEIYRNSGAAGFPFTRLPGPHIERGCASPYTIAKGENTWAWLGSDRRVYAMKGYTPQRISTHGIEHKINTFSRIDTAFSPGVINWKGHVWYVLSFPDDDTTFIYDSTTNEWHERVTSFLGLRGEGGTGYTVPDLEWQSLFCGCGYGTVWADRPHDPGIFVMGVASNSSAGSSQSGDGVPGVILSQNGKNWYRPSVDALIGVGVQQANTLGYSREQDQLMIAYNGIGSQEGARSIDGGMSWTEDLGITDSSGQFSFWVSAWGLWFFGNRDGSNNLQLRRSATGVSGSWTVVSLSGLSVELNGINNWGGMAYSSTLSIGVLNSYENGFIWSTNGTSWSDAATFPTSPSTTRWIDVVWASGISKFVAVGLDTGTDFFYFATSTDGKNWTSGVLDNDADLGFIGSLAYSPSLGVLLAPGTADDPQTAAMWKSTDGATWTRVSDTVISGAASLQSMAWSPYKEIFVVGGKDETDTPGGTIGDGIVLWSEDADNWTRATQEYA